MLTGYEDIGSFGVISDNVFSCDGRGRKQEKDRHRATLLPSIILVVYAETLSLVITRNLRRDCRR